MKLPHLFRQVHATSIFNAWMRNGQPPIVRIVPIEPLRYAAANFDTGVTPDNHVSVITLRCWNDRGTMQFEAASEADWQVAKEWAARHAETAPGDFEWVPEFWR